MVRLTVLLHALGMGCYAAALLLSVAGLSASRRSRARLAVVVTGAGLAIQTVLLVARWKASSHLPVTGLFESLHFLAFWVAALTLYFHLRYDAAPLLPASLALILVSLAGASLGPKDILPLTPALDTPLFLIHVATSFAAYGFFGVGALLGLYRITGNPLPRAGAGRRMLDESLYLGYLLFTWTMIAGSLWAYLAWGSYWTWTTKGLWSYLLWFYYSGVMHVRNRTSWQGWPLSLISIAGFLLALFTFLGLGLLFKTSHPLM